MVAFTAASLIGMAGETMLHKESRNCMCLADFVRAVNLRVVLTLVLKDMVRLLLMVSNTILIVAVFPCTAELCLSRSGTRAYLLQLGLNPIVSCETLGTVLHVLIMYSSNQLVMRMRS